jgi:hypothetical protein
MATSLSLGRESSGRAGLARRLAADPRFVVEDFEPCYRRLTVAELAAKSSPPTGGWWTAGLARL